MSEKRNAIVTGSTSGIGLATARALAAQQMNVVLNGFGNAEEIEILRAGIAHEFGVQVRYSNADMRDGQAIETLVTNTIEAFGSVDVLVNNAGVQHVSPVEDFSVDKWDQIIAINLSAAFHAVRAVVPGMKQRRWGRIINTASAHALVASPFKSAYVAAKHGIAGFTKSIALEVATFGITVNSICPGYVWTSLVESQIPDTMKARGMTAEQVKRDVMLAAQPTKEFITVDQVAALVVFLCSDAASQMTGSNIAMDGGWTAQ